MSLPTPRTIYGIHSVAPYSRTDGTFYGILKVLDGSNYNLAGALVKLNGGSNKYPWDVQEGLINAEVALKVSEYPDFLFTLFLGQAPTSAASSSTGTCSTLTNKLGTSVKQATTGIASVGITASTGKALLKFAKYVVLATDTTHVDVYASTDEDFAAGGTSATYQDGLLKITASPLAISASGTTVIPNTGLEFVGGSGTIGMTAADTATFEVIPPNSGQMTCIVGAAASTFPEFGMIAMSKKKGNHEMFELDIFRCKGVGLPIGFTMNQFSKADIKVESFYDSTKDAIFEVRSAISTNTG